MTKEFAKSVVNIVNSDYVQSAIATLNDDTDGSYEKAMRSIAMNCSPVVRSEVHKALQQTLPFYSLETITNEMRLALTPSTCGSLTDDRFWAYAIPDHGYLPQRLSMGNAATGGVPGQPTIYRLGHSIDWWCGTALITSDFLCDIIQSYINGFIKKICNDAFNCVLSAAFHKNSVIVGDRLEDCLHNIMMHDIKDNDNIQSLTDIYVSDEVFLGLSNTDDTKVVEITGNADEIYYIVNHNRVGEQTYTIHRTSKLNKGGEWHQLLVLAPDQGGLGLVQPKNTHSLIFGVNKNNNGQIHLYKNNMGFCPDTSSYTHRSQMLGFYGWMLMGCRVSDNKYVQLGAVRNAR